MKIVAKVGAALQLLFGEIVDHAHAAAPVVLRRRQFTPGSLARTFVLGFLENPRASDEELAQVAARCGASVTPQAVEQRHTKRLVQFLEELFRRAIKVVVESEQSLAPLLERFSAVTLLDSSVITLPNGQKERFPGCGGSYDSSQAAVKLQTEQDLCKGGITHIEIESGKSPDGATCRQQAEHPKGSLRITDLGYFNVSVFTDFLKQSVYILSRWQFGTGVLLPNGQEINLLKWLSEQPPGIIEQPILLGKKERLACRLIAWRVPEEQAARRRHKLRQETRRKRGQEPCAERLAMCDWTVLVTTIPESLLNGREAIVLYRARWQIELLFKRWKSQGLVADLSGTTEVRQMVRLWSRLIAALVQHWLVVGCTWNDPCRSLSKACEAVRKFIAAIVNHLDYHDRLEEVLGQFRAVVAKTCRRNKKRGKPGTLDLLNNLDSLEFRLT